MSKLDRTPEDTRQAILMAAFEEIHEHGFQAASLSRILSRAGVTKGALYHHFGSKKDLGYAVVDEVIGDVMAGRWEAAGGLDDPIAAIGATLLGSLEEVAPRYLECGCPLNNLAQEMSPIDEGFRTRVSDLFRRWRRGLAVSLRSGQRAGTVRKDIDPDKVAAFIVGTIEGTIGLAKNERSVELLRGNLEILLDYLETLKPARALV